MARGLIIAAPSSGSGKTVVTLGLLRALRDRGIRVASAKAGPDYIDPRFHEAATGKPCFNLDPWAMDRAMILGLLAECAADLVIIEGVMGLFDGPEAGRGSTADLAEDLGLPVLLVVDARHQAQSAGALVQGFAQHRAGVRLAGVILNRVASDKHARMLRGSIAGIPVAGCVARQDALALPSRHLGLVQAGEHAELERFIAGAAEVMARELDLDAICALAAPVPSAALVPPLPPLAQRIAVAADQAFAFAYPHLLHGWRKQGAEIIPFSPLADERADPGAGAIFLPGGYPELHAGRLAANRNFLDSLKAPLIYGECGGYMVLGEYLIDAAGQRHRMAGLLPLGTSFAERRLHLGYRRLHHTALPFPASLKGHEFHYASIDWQGEAEPLFTANDAADRPLPPMGLRRGGVMGSFAHIIA